MTLNETFPNETNQTDTASLNHNRPNYVVTPSSETTKGMSKVRDKKTRTSYSRGITYYFWDTVFLILKCFKDHWKTGIIDCVTARASTMLDGLLGIGDTRRHQLLKQGGLMPYDETLEETPRNEEGLPLDEDDEEDQEEQEAYDEEEEEATDSREGELGLCLNSSCVNSEYNARGFGNFHNGVAEVPSLLEGYTVPTGKQWLSRDRSAFETSVYLFTNKHTVTYRRFKC
jgi:hypothetical protein